MGHLMRPLAGEASDDGPTVVNGCPLCLLTSQAGSGDTTVTRECPARILSSKASGIGTIAMAGCQLHSLVGETLLSLRWLGDC